MIVRVDGRLFRLLATVANPAPWLPKLLPVSFYPVRVGTDCRSFAKLAWEY
jgi:hypothetical protein